MQEAFEKLKGMDIFSLKSYTVQTGFLRNLGDVQRNLCQLSLFPP